MIAGIFALSFVLGSRLLGIHLLFLYIVVRTTCIATCSPSGLASAEGSIHAMIGADKQATLTGDLADKCFESSAQALAERCRGFSQANQLTVSLISHPARHESSRGSPMDCIIFIVV